MPAGDALDEFELSEEEQQQIQSEPVSEPAQEPPPAEPAAVPEAQPAPVQPEPIQPKMVPLAALHQARQELRELRGKLGELDVIKNQLMQMREEKVLPPAPTLEEDPFGALAHRMSQIEAQNRQANEALLRAAQLAQEEQATQKQVETLNNHIAIQEATFKQANPDYNDAINYLAQIKTREFAALGVTDPVTVQQQLQKIAWQSAAQLIASGQDHAEVFYNMARAYGYQKAAPAPVAPPVQPAAPAATDPQFAAIAKGQQQATTVKGGDATAQVTVQALLDASPDDFDRQWEQLFGNRKRAY